MIPSLFIVRDGAISALDGTNFIRKTMMIEGDRKDVATAGLEHSISFFERFLEKRYMLQNVACKDKINGVVLKMGALNIYMQYLPHAFPASIASIYKLGSDVVDARVSLQAVMQGARSFRIPDTSPEGRL